MLIVAPGVNGIELLTSFAVDGIDPYCGVYTEPYVGVLGPVERELL